jgi:hypothetical protein
MTPLRTIDQNLWVAEQPFRFWGLDVGSRMTVMRLTASGLVVISPIRMDTELVQQLNALGRVAYVIAPNLYHHLFIQDFCKIYPQAQCWVPPGLARKQPDLQPDNVMDSPSGTLEGQIDYHLVQGFMALTDLSGPAPVNEFVFFHRESRTLILTDTAFHFDEQSPWLTQWVARSLGQHKLLRATVLEKWASRDHPALTASVRQILAWDFQRVIMAHGSIIETNAKQRFKEGYEWFLQTAL